MESNKKTLIELCREEINESVKLQLHAAEIDMIKYKNTLFSSLNDCQRALATDFEKALNTYLLLVKNESFLEGLYMSKHLK